MYFQGLHGDIVSHQQPTLSLVYQAQQLLEHNKPDFSEEQLSKLDTVQKDVKKKLELVRGTPVLYFMQIKSVASFQTFNK